MKTLSTLTAALFITLSVSAQRAQQAGAPQADNSATPSMLQTSTPARATMATAITPESHQQTVTASSISAGDCVMSNTGQIMTVLKMKGNDCICTWIDKTSKISRQESFNVNTVSKTSCDNTNPSK